MSEILTRDEIQRSAHYVGMLVEFGIDSDEGAQNVRQMEASHLALHDALDAALERSEERDGMWRGNFQDFLVTMIDMALLLRTLWRPARRSSARRRASCSRG